MLLSCILAQQFQKLVIKRTGIIQLMKLFIKDVKDEIFKYYFEWNFIPVFWNNIENENVKWKSLTFILNCDEQLRCFFLEFQKLM